MRTYIVLLNWNGALDTIACLESVLRLQNVEFRTVVCDNGSTDDSITALRRWAVGEAPPDLAGNPIGLTESLPKPLRLVEYARGEAEGGGHPAEDDGASVYLLHTGANLGFAGGCNVGIRFAMARGDADFVWLLNNDTMVDPQALAALVTRASRPDRPGIVGSLLCYFDAPDRIQSLGGGTYSPHRAMSRHIADGQLRQALTQAELEAAERDMVYVVGASMLVSRRFLDTVGVMQEDYFLYFEEMDWAERARRLDPTLGIAFAADSVVYHKVGASAGTQRRSMLSLRYLTVNRLRFVRRFYAANLPAARLSVAWEGLKALLKGRLDEARLMLGVALSPIKI